MSLDHVREEVSAALKRLSRLFTDECKLTFVMRHPTIQECYLVITDDDPRAVAATLQEHPEQDDS